MKKARRNFASKQRSTETCLAHLSKTAGMKLHPGRYHLYCNLCYGFGKGRWYYYVCKRETSGREVSGLSVLSRAGELHCKSGIIVGCRYAYPSLHECI